VAAGKGRAERLRLSSGLGLIVPGDDLIASGPFRRVGAPVSRLHQLMQRLAVRSESRHPRTQCHAQSIALDWQRRCNQALAQAVGNRVGLRSRAAGQQDGKFLTPPRRRNRSLLRKHRGEVRQGVVADIVTETVIDLLEVVDIDEDQR